MLHIPQLVTIDHDLKGRPKLSDPYQLEAALKHASASVARLRSRARGLPCYDIAQIACRKGARMRVNCNPHLQRRVVTII